MTVPEATDAAEFEVRIAARPETVFQFFTDPVKMMMWKGVDAALDARPGGIYRVNVTGRETARGEYVEVTPYSRIVFTWGWEEGPLLPGASLVEVSFIPDGSETIVRLRHSGLSGEALASHAEGWNHFLPRLALAAAGKDPGVDPWTQGPPQ
jgi:uncharacterized protein YndB with AHSA1/START domain